LSSSVKRDWASVDNTKSIGIYNLVRIAVNSEVKLQRVGSKSRHKRKRYRDYVVEHKELGIEDSKI